MIKVEKIVNYDHRKEIFHITEEGTDTIKFDKKGDDKAPLVLKYVNDQCNERNLELDKINNNGQVEIFYLVSRE